MAMSSLLTFTTNVSLISITVTPGTFVACVIVFLCFVALYIPWTPVLRLPQRLSLPSLPLRQQQQQQQQHIYSPQGRSAEKQHRFSSSKYRELSRSPKQLVLRDFSLLSSRNGRASYDNKDDEVNVGAVRRHGRFLKELWGPDQPKPTFKALLDAPEQRTSDGSRSVRRRGGFGNRFRRWWLQSARMEETRQRRPQQRLLEGSPR